MDHKKLSLKMLDERLTRKEREFIAIKTEFIDLSGRVTNVENSNKAHASEFRNGFDAVRDQINGLQKSMEKIGHDFAKELKVIGEGFTEKIDDVVTAVNGLKVTEGRVEGIISVLKPIAMALFAAAVGYYVGGK